MILEARRWNEADRYTAITAKVLDGYRDQLTVMLKQPYSAYPARKRRRPASPAFLASGAPDTIRTYDLPLRRGTLYPTELRGLKLALHVLYTTSMCAPPLYNAPAIGPHLRTYRKHAVLVALLWCASHLARAHPACPPQHSRLAISTLPLSILTRHNATRI